MPAVFGARHVPVVATFDVVEYRGSVVCMGAMWIIGVLRDVRKRIGKGVGDMIQVTLQRDAGQREVDIPDDLLSALEEIPSTKECFLYLSYTHKREHIEYINEEKKSATRIRRILRAVSLTNHGNDEIGCQLQIDTSS